MDLPLTAHPDNRLRDVDAPHNIISLVLRRGVAMTQPKDVFERSSGVEG